MKNYSQRVGAWTVTLKLQESPLRRRLVEFFHDIEGVHHQVAVMTLEDGYFRLCPLGSDWATSIITVPSFQEAMPGEREPVYRQGYPVVLSNMTSQGDDLSIQIDASFRGLHVRGKIVITSPTPHSLTARVEMNANWSTPLAYRKGESFKPVFLSSMRISTHVFDASEAVIEGTKYAIPSQGIFPDIYPVTTMDFGLIGGTCIHTFPNDAGVARDGVRLCSNVTIQLDRPMEIMGYVTPSQDHNDDNVGLWANYDGGLQYWSYEIEAS